MNNSGGPFLIVDDEPEMCWTLNRILTGIGGVCHTASNAKEAVALAEFKFFRVAFLDVKLPDNDGLVLARRIRASNILTRMVIVSGYFYRDDPIIVEAIRSKLIAAFIAKPFDHHEILRAIGSPRKASPGPEAGPVRGGSIIRIKSACCIIIIAFIRNLFSIFIDL